MAIWPKRWLLPAVVVVLLAIQVFRPARTNPAVDAKRGITASVEVPIAVAAIFDRACNDCHSNQTVWPWYSSVAPVSWLVAHDVNEGRREMNFSEWSGYEAEKLGKLRKEICEEVSEGEMPGFIYTLMHAEAKLTDSDIREVCRWTQAGG
jgi:hypothetical protein